MYKYCLVSRPVTSHFETIGIGINTIHYNIVNYNTVQYNSIKYNIVQYSTIIENIKRTYVIHSYFQNKCIAKEYTKCNCRMCVKLR